MISYNFIRSGSLTSREFHLLSIIDSYSGESHLKTAQYAEMLKCSTRTIKRVIKSLVLKGYLSIRYGLFKSIHLSLMNIKEVLWKPNLKKIFKKSKVTKCTFKSDNRGTTNIESNKENNKAKGIKYPLFKEEVTDFNYDMPIIARNMLDELKNRLNIN